MCRFRGCGLLAQVSCMNTIMSQCIPGYHSCVSLVSLVVCRFMYRLYVGYLVRCVGQLVVCFLAVF